jgi:hypothetical protein
MWKGPSHTGPFSFMQMGNKKLNRYTRKFLSTLKDCGIIMFILFVG